MACRFLGLQPFGVDMPFFTRTEGFVEGYGPPRDWSVVIRVGKYVLGFLNYTLLFSLLFVSHDRYQKQVHENVFKKFLSTIPVALSCLRPEKVKFVFTHLKTLYQLGIQFSIEEGSNIFSKIIDHHDKSHVLSYLEKFFSLLKENKFSMLQAIKSKWSLKNIFDTADFLQENEPAVKEKYSGDMLIFLGLSI